MKHGVSMRLRVQRSDFPAKRRGLAIAYGAADLTIAAACSYTRAMAGLSTLSSTFRASSFSSTMRMGVRAPITPHATCIRVRYAGAVS